MKNGLLNVESCPTMLNRDTVPAPRRALPTADHAQKCMMLIMPVTTQIMHTRCTCSNLHPAMDVQTGDGTAGGARAWAHGPFFSGVSVSAMLNYDGE